MAAKPTDVPRWNTDASNRTDPSSGQKDTGWTLNQKGVSSYMNWLLYVIYTWVLYLQDLALVAPMTLTTGANSVRLEVNAADTLELRNGADSAAGNLVCGTITASGLITASAGATAASGQHFTVSGGGQYKHGSRQLYIPAYKAMNPSEEWVPTNGYLVGSGGSGVGQCWVPIDLPAGKRIIAATVRIGRDTTDTITAKIFEADQDGVETELATVDSTTSSVANETRNLVTGDVDIETTKSYYFRIDRSAPNANLKLFWCSVLYTEP